MLKSTSRLFSNRNFLALFSSQTLSAIGISIYSFALLCDMKVLTNNPFLMSLVGFAWMVPVILLGPIAGVIADRSSKRRVMMYSDVFRLLLTMLVTVLSLMHDLSPWEIIVVTFFSNAVATLFNPAASALLPHMVTSEQLPSANGLSQAMMPLSQILGPAISAGLIAWQGVTVSFAINALTYLISATTLLLIRVNEPKKEKKPFNFKHVKEELIEGWQAIHGISLLMILIPVGAFINFLFAPFDIYLVQFVTVILHKNQVLLGELNAVFAVGMLLGSIISGPVSKLVRIGFVMIGSMLLIGVMLPFMAMIHLISLDFTFMLLMGMGIGLTNTSLFSLIQQVIAKGVMGRVFAFLGTLFSAISPIGMLIGGAMANVVPVTWLILVDGILTVLLSLIAFLYPVVRQFDVHKYVAGLSAASNDL